jgi:hypothetical protein
LQSAGIKNLDCCNKKLELLQKKLRAAAIKKMAGYPAIFFCPNVNLKETGPPGKANCIKL